MFSSIDYNANLAALEEWKYYQGREFGKLIYLAINTGFGGGIHYDNQILQSEIGLVAEIGHLTIVQDGLPYSGEHLGHYEPVASGTAINNKVMRLNQKGETPLPPSLDQISAHAVQVEANQGDRLSNNLLASDGQYTGRAVADLIHIFYPKAIIVGGCISQSGDLFINPIRQGIRKYCMTTEYLQNLTISSSKHQTEPELIGARITAESRVPIEEIN